MFSSAQTKGNTNILCIGGSNFSPVTPTSVIDSAGNSYTLVPGCSHTGETGGNWNTWVYICEGIKAAGAGTNEITVVMSGNCGYALLSIVAVEEPASAGVRDAVLNFQGFTSQFPNVTLTGTVLDDVVCAFMQCEPNNTDYVQVGDIGSNPATQLQLFYPNLSTEFIFLAQDGVSPGGTISVTATGTTPSYFTAVAVALIPAPMTTDPLFYGVD